MCIGNLTNIGITKSITIGVCIPAFGICTITVFINIIIWNLSSSRINIGITIITICIIGYITGWLCGDGLTYSGITIAISIEISIPNSTIRTITVFINTVTGNLSSGRVNIRIAIITIGTIGYIIGRFGICDLTYIRVTKSITIGVCIPCFSICTIAVFINIIIWYFACSRVNCGITIITIGIVSYIIGRFGICDLTYIRVTKSITIGVCIPGFGICTITVFINIIVWYFSCTWIYGGLCIIAIGFITNITGNFSPDAIIRVTISVPINVWVPHI